MGRLDLLIVVLSFSINPFFRKSAIKDFNNHSGYALLQISTAIGNSIYLFINKKNIDFNQLQIKHTQNLALSSSLTILSSYKMNQLLKKNDISNLTAKIQILTIMTSYVLDYRNLKEMTKQEYLGIILMISGLILTKSN